MSQLWYRRNGDWIAESLAAERSLAEWRAGASLVAFRGAESAGGGHALLCLPASVRVNGEVVATGIRVLRDRDEIVCSTGERLFFSSENVAELVAFPGLPSGDDREARCPRCLTAIAPGMAAVACPRCGVFYHQMEGRRCFDFHDRCVSCDHPTVDVGEPSFAWTPCEL